MLSRVTLVQALLEPKPGVLQNAGIGLATGHQDGSYQAADGVRRAIGCKAAIIST